MKLRYTIILFVFLLTCFDACFSELDLKVRVRRVYLELVRAEREGADIGEAVAKLDEALQLVIRAGGVNDPAEKSKLLSRAEALINEVESSIPELVEAGKAEAQLRLVINVVSLLSLIVIAVLVYFYCPKVLWGLWLRFRGDWRVKRVD